MWLQVSPRHVINLEFLLDVRVGTGTRDSTFGRQVFLFQFANADFNQEGILEIAEERVNTAGRNLLNWRRPPGNGFYDRPNADMAIPPSESPTYEHVTVGAREEPTHSMELSGEGLRGVSILTAAPGNILEVPESTGVIRNVPINTEYTYRMSSTL